MTATGGAWVNCSISLGRFSIINTSIDHRRLFIGVWVVRLSLKEVYLRCHRRDKNEVHVEGGCCEPCGWCREWMNQERTDTAHSKEWAVLVESWQKFRTNRSRNKCDHYSGWRKRDRYWNNDHRPPTRNATQKKEFQRLIAELKRLASKKKATRKNSWLPRLESRQWLSITGGRGTR